MQVLAPLIRDKKGHHQGIFDDIRKEGFVRARVDGTVRDVNEEIELDRYKIHNIEAVVDRLVVPERLENGDSKKDKENLQSPTPQCPIRVHPVHDALNGLGGNGPETGRWLLHRHGAGTALCAALF